MAYGFDPSIILSSKQYTGPDANETMRTLAQLAGAAQQRELHQATLADMVRQQQQQQTLAGIYRANADTPTSLPSALMRSGFGPQAFEAQNQGVQLQQHQAQTGKIFQELQAQLEKYTGESFYGVKDQAGWEQARNAVLTKAKTAPFGAGDMVAQQVAQLIPEKFDAAAAQRLGNLAVPADKRAQLAQGGAELEEKTRHNKEEERLGKARMSPGGELPDLSQSALDIQVQQAVKTGAAPKFGAGPLGDKRRTAFWNRVAELYPTADLATNRATYDANRGSLGEGQKLADLTDVNEGKALADIKVLEDKMAPIFDSRSPLLNSLGRKLEEGSGDPQVAAFHAARQALVAQVNRVLNAGNLTDSGRKEAEELLKSDSSIAQIKSVLDVLKQDMARSREATHKRVSTSRARIAGKPGDASPEADEGADTVMVLPPGSNTPVPVHRAKLDAAIKAGGKLVPGG